MYICILWHLRQLVIGFKYYTHRTSYGSCHYANGSSVTITGMLLIEKYQIQKSREFAHKQIMK